VLLLCQFLSHTSGAKLPAVVLLSGGSEHSFLLTKSYSDRLHPVAWTLPVPASPPHAAPYMMGARAMWVGECDGR
jgi:hypothetical protein